MQGSCYVDPEKLTGSKKTTNLKKIRYLFKVFIATALVNMQEAGCGRPRLLERWDNITAAEGERVTLRCPLDTTNTCLVDSVEW